MLTTIIYYTLPVLIGIAAIRKYKDITWGRCNNKESLEGKTVLITGANTGIGYETAKELAKRKAKIIFACRNMKSALQSIEQIKSSVGDCRELVAMQLDLSSLSNVREFANKVTDLYPKIHILVNNAGVYSPMDERHKTEDGFEIHFGVNHLGHFLLTNLLVENLKKAAPSRVVIVSSLLHEKGRIDLEDLNMNEYYKKFGNQKSIMNPGYQNSKLANAYFGMELAKKTKGSGVDVYSVCPGFTDTGLFRDVKKWYHYLLFAPIALFSLRTARQGAQTIIHCATEPSLLGESGHFYRNCARYKSKVNFDEKISKALWEISSKLVGLAK